MQLKPLIRFSRQRFYSTTTFLGFCFCEGCCDEEAVFTADVLFPEFPPVFAVVFGLLFSDVPAGLEVPVLGVSVLEAGSTVFGTSLLGAGAGVTGS